jgi:hypothetical protein
MKNNDIIVRDDVNAISRYFEYQNNMVKSIEDDIKNAEVSWLTVYDTCTIMVAKLKDGRVITESANAKNKDKYDTQVAKLMCIEKLKSKMLMSLLHSLHSDEYDPKYRIVNSLDSSGKED